MVRRLLPVAALVASAALAAPAAAQIPPYPIYPTVPAAPVQPAQPSQPDQGAQPSQPSQPAQPIQSSSALAPVTIRDQNDGVNSRRTLTVAAFCRGPASCAGTAKLVKGGQTLASAPFNAAGKTTFKTPMKLRASVFRALRRAKGKRMKPTLTLTLTDGGAFSHVITIRI